MREAVASGQLPAVQVLAGTDRLSFNLDSTREYMVCALTNMQATGRAINWLEGRIDVMRHQPLYLSSRRRFLKGVTAVRMSKDFR